MVIKKVMPQIKEAKLPALPIKVDFSQARGRCYPNRCLILPCKIENPESDSLAILHTWIEIELKDKSVTIAEGVLLKMFHAMVDYATITPSKAASGEIRIPLSPACIHEIEKVRNGGDLKFTLSTHIHASRVITKRNQTFLSAPALTYFSIQGHDRGEMICPQSEWIRILKEMGWAEIELIEVYSSGFRVPGVQDNVRKRIEDAQMSFRRGDWESTLGYCRKVFEALFADETGKPDMRQVTKFINDLLGENRKAASVDKLISALGSFQHLGRHQSEDSVCITRDDAELCLLVSGAVVGYLSKPH